MQTKTNTQPAESVLPLLLSGFIGHPENVQDWGGNPNSSIFAPWTPHYTSLSNIDNTTPRDTFLHVNIVALHINMKQTYDISPKGKIQGWNAPPLFLLEHDVPAWLWRSCPCQWSWGGGSFQYVGAHRMWSCDTEEDSDGCWSLWAVLGHLGSHPLTCARRERAREDETCGPLCGPSPAYVHMHKRDSREISSTLLDYTHL